MSNLH